MARLETEIAIGLARLDGMKTSLDIIENSNTKVKVPSQINQSNDPAATVDRQRRFRLGAKKRVVFQLVNDFAISLRQIEEAVTGYDIDLRYIREVVRTSIAEGDMSCDVEGTFVITSSGTDMLQEAPLPKEWDAYKAIFEEQKASNARANKASKSLNQNS